jgi:starch-binding outer membrane protein, SusD/RagB family
MFVMKRYFVLLLLVAGLASCEKHFLQVPSTTGTTTIESTFSTTVNANGAIAAAYANCLIAGLPYSGLDHGTIAALSGELSWGYNWHMTYKIINTGLNANGQSDDDFDGNYSDIREAYLIYENIDNVKDMDAATKTNVKGEMLGLVAYRYMGMFIRYGGVPIVSKSLTSSDTLDIPRSTLQALQDTITSLCDRAAAMLPASWPTQYSGRLTSGVALAIKARTLMYAARPLFNSSAPVLSLGSNNNMICFGSANQSKWQDAIDATNAAIAWAGSNGFQLINTGGGTNQPNTNAFADYGTATSTPGNIETILAYKNDNSTSGMTKYFTMSAAYYTVGDGYDMDNYGMETNFLENYYKADGTDQVWPGVGASNALPATDYFTKMNEMEPRFKADNMWHAASALNNPGDQGWDAANCDRGVNQAGSAGKGAANSVKFHYLCGSRAWFEFPLFRMAELYLNLAEAYNETGNSAQALINLNLVHNRAGLPSITETDQTTLRTIIQREWAVEYYNENQRYFLVKHWKLPTIDNGLMGGPRREFQFTTNGQNVEVPTNLLTYYDQVVFNAYWDPKQYLEPIPQSEINKLILVQNPGY